MGQEALDAEDQETRKQKLAVASCTVEEALAGLQEALQDDRVEVEEAANKLFADLQTAGVLTR
ncbi:hypothetical protein Ciccas_009368 [Cichlidogyrus casuarinus]|uniref:Uncharacterized protein n=1 Tax=Cichlidogyrus casuarinus TaxID=1844966 RepID=A0ABD2PX90_9PLAT